MECRAAGEVRASEYINSIHPVFVLLSHGACFRGWKRGAAVVTPDAAFVCEFAAWLRDSISMLQRIAFDIGFCRRRAAM